MNLFLSFLLCIVPFTYLYAGSYDDKLLNIKCSSHSVVNRDSNKTYVLGSVRLQAKDPDFGGFSGAVMTKDKKKIILITDRGRLLTARPMWKGHQITCLKGGIMRTLRDTQSRPLTGHSADAEGLSFTDNEDTVLISFERKHRIIEYDLKKQRLTPRRDFKKFRDQKLGFNTSYEATRYLHGNKIIGFPEEDLKDDDILRGYILDVRKNTLKTLFLKYRNYMITDLAVLNNGDILTLERTFNFLSGMLIQMRHIKYDDFISGAMPADGEVVFKMTTSEGSDNFEAVIVSHSKDGNFIYLVSDDNFLSLQQTLILSLFYPLKI